MILSANAAGLTCLKSGMKAEMDESNRKWEEGQQAQRRFQEDGGSVRTTTRTTSHKPKIVPMMKSKSIELKPGAFERFEERV